MLHRTATMEGLGVVVQLCTDNQLHGAAACAARLVRPRCGWLPATDRPSLCMHVERCMLKDVQAASHSSQSLTLIQEKHKAAMKHKKAKIAERRRNYKMKKAAREAGLQL